MVEPTGYTALDLIGFSDKGVYDPTAYYVKNDLVHYLGSIWRVKVDDTHGVTPAEGGYYTIFVNSPTGAAEKIIAPIEISPATSAHSVGDQLIYNDKLYNVIKAISANGTLITYETDPTNGNIKLAASVSSQIQALTNQDTVFTNEISDIVNILGAKNLFGGIFTSIVNAGVTYVANSDGTVSVQGTVESGHTYSGCYSSHFILPKGSYILNGSAVANQSYLDIYDINNHQLAGSRNNNDAFFTINENTEVYLRIIIIPTDGTVNYTYKPMIRLASVQDDTFVPYVPTNRVLNNNISKEIAYGFNIETIGKAAKGAYYINNRFIATDGYIYRATSEISANTTIIEGGNCIKSSILSGLNTVVKLSNLKNYESGNVSLADICNAAPIGMTMYYINSTSQITDYNSSYTNMQYCQLIVIRYGVVRYGILIGYTGVHHFVRVGGSITWID